MRVLNSIWDSTGRRAVHWPVLWCKTGGMRLVPSAGSLLRLYFLAALFAGEFARTASSAASEEGPCICDRLLSPVCSATSGKYVSTSSNCAVQCSGFPDAVGCVFLRYYSWRRRCSCSMMLPERSGGVCDAESGVMLSKSTECWECQKQPMDDSTLSCDNLPDGMTPLFPDLPPQNCTTPSCVTAGRAVAQNYYGNYSDDDGPACSMVNGKEIAGSRSEALRLGHTHTLPCHFLQGCTTAAYIDPEYCLFGEEAGAFVGKVAGWAACKAVLHKCVAFEWVDSAMVHSLCNTSPQCPAEADKLAMEWPACAHALRMGTDQCGRKKVQRIWDEAVSALCEPFGPADYS